MFSNLGFFKELLGRCNDILHRKEVIVHREVQTIRKAINEHLFDLKAELTRPVRSRNQTQQEWVDLHQAGLTVLADSFLNLTCGREGNSTKHGCAHLCGIVQAACEGLISLLGLLRGRYTRHFNNDVPAPEYTRRLFEDQLPAILSDIREKLKQTPAIDLFEILSSKSRQYLKCGTFTYRQLDYWNELLWKLSAFADRPDRVSADELYALLVYFNFNCSWLYQYRSARIREQLAVLAGTEDELRYLHRLLKDTNQLQVRSDTALHPDQPVHRDQVREFIGQEISFLKEPSGQPDVWVTVPPKPGEEVTMKTNLPVEVLAVLIRLLFEAKVLYGTSKEKTVNFYFKYVVNECEKRGSERNMQNEYYQLAERTELRLLDLLHSMIRNIQAIKRKRDANSEEDVERHIICNICDAPGVGSRRVVQPLQGQNRWKSAHSFFSLPHQNLQ